MFHLSSVHVISIYETTNIVDNITSALLAKYESFFYQNAWCHIFDTFHPTVLHLNVVRFHVCWLPWHDYVVLLRNTWELLTSSRCCALFFLKFRVHMIGSSCTGHMCHFSCDVYVECCCDCKHYSCLEMHYGLMESDFVCLECWNAWCHIFAGSTFYIYHFIFQCVCVSKSLHLAQELSAPTWCCTKLYLP